MDSELSYKGAYFPSFFSISLSGDFDTQLENLSVKDLGTFAHEYLHYIQNIDTLIGLANSQYFHIFIAELRAYIEKEPKLKLPLKNFDISEKTRLNQSRFDRNKETKNNHKIPSYDDIEIEVSNNDNIVYVHFVSNSKRVFKTQYGNLAVKEGMSYFFQKKYDSNITPPTIPYLLTKILCEKLNPNLLKEEKAIIFLSYLSLNSLNCGKIMYENIIDSNKLNWNTPLELYRKLKQNTSISINEKKYSVPQVKEFAINKLKETINHVLSSDIIYLNKVFSNIEHLSSSSSASGFIELVNNENLNNIELLYNLIDIYGLPHISTFSGKNFLNEESPELIELIGQRIVAKRLLHDDTTCCSMITSCQQNNEIVTDDNCYEYQWRREQECPFKVTFDNWGLRGKIE